MSNLILTIGILIVAAIVGAVFLINKSRKKQQPADAALLLIQNQIQEIIRTLDNKMSEANKSIEEQF